MPEQPPYPPAANMPEDRTRSPREGNPYIRGCIRIYNILLSCFNFFFPFFFNFYLFFSSFLLFFFIFSAFFCLFFLRIYINLEDFTSYRLY